MLSKALKMVSVGLLAVLPLCLAERLQAQPAPAECAQARASSAMADTSAASSAPRALPAVCGVTIHPEPNGAATVDIATSRGIPYHIMKLGHPSRLVVDFEGARNAVPRERYQAQSAALARVRVGQWRATRPAVVRVVADLNGSPELEIHRQPWGVRVELKPRASEAEAERATSRPRRRPEDPLRPAARNYSPGSEFPVHQFADLSASLTTPALPPHDHLVPLVNNAPRPVGRRTPEKLAEVYGIAIKPNADGETLVDIASSESVPYRVFQLVNPLRLVVDLKDARNASRREVYPAESPVLKRVRIGQWRQGGPSVVRIVADLEGSPMFDVHAQQPGIRIELKPRPAPGALIRNPFEFRHSSPNVRVSAPQDTPPMPAAQALAAPPAGSTSLLSLRALGYVQKAGIGPEAIMGDNLGVYVVPPGETFENRFRLLQITSTAVQVQDVTTNQTAWLQFIP
ncbi:MAG TPA: AMIN domain-containing protein [Terriglobia bacterium]|nr:AMIN domain-containing protein [Terriglobia bacterium]